MLSVGTLGSTEGTRSSGRNILFVPHQHDDYYDDYYDNGCNWVIYPVMTRDEMVNWTGDPYWVAIFTGELAPEGNKEKQQGNIWKDKPSRYGAKEAEEALTDKLSDRQDIDVCSTSDLRTVGEGLGEMGLAVADLHTRESSDSDFKARIIDLASTVN
jgi:hypothetical protein